MKSLKNICKRGHFPLRYTLKIPARELMFSKVATWRPAKLAYKYVLKTLLIFPEAFCDFLQVWRTFHFQKTSNCTILEAVVLYLLTDILPLEEVLSEVILQFTNLTSSIAGTAVCSEIPFRKNSKSAAWFLYD